MSVTVLVFITYSQCLVLSQDRFVEQQLFSDTVRDERLNTAELLDKLSETFLRSCWRQETVLDLIHQANMNRTPAEL